MSNPPYIRKEVVTVVYGFNPNYGDDRMCKCGDVYYRHFDDDEDMLNVGCMDCLCNKFVEAKKVDKNE